MKGDFTRSTFDPTKRYGGVRMQQGRVQLDADWNEQLDIQRHIDDLSTADTFGPGGIPSRPESCFAVTADGGVPTLKAGRAYVGGVLCENPRDAAFSALGDRADAAPAAPSTGSTWLVYLDAWRDHVTALEDPALREVALGGADTATRDRVMWRLRWQAQPFPNDATAGTDPTDGPPTGDWLAKQRGRREKDLGRLAVRARVASDAVPAGVTPECTIPAQGGYQRTENALYRVEVHAGGAVGEASFKWSRENAVVVARCDQCTGTGASRTLHLLDAGRDVLQAFAENDQVELTTDAREVACDPSLTGMFASVVHCDVESSTLEVEVTGGSLDWFATAISAGEFCKVRRWEAVPVVIMQDTGDTTLSPWVDLAAGGLDGIQLRFQVRDGTTALRFQPGDYWLIPARAGVLEIPWPLNGANPAFVPPRGMQHGYMPLADLTYNGTAWTLARDRRAEARITPLTALRQLVYLGDPKPTPYDPELFKIDVAVVEGQRMIPNVAVRFTQSGDCALGATSTSVSETELLVTTLGGVATCYVRLAERADSAFVTVHLEPLEPGAATPYEALRFPIRRQGPWQKLTATSLVFDLDARARSTLDVTAGKVEKWRSCVNAAHEVSAPSTAWPRLSGVALAGFPAVRFDADAYLTVPASVITSGSGALDQAKLMVYVVGLAAPGAGYFKAVARQHTDVTLARWAIGMKSETQPFAHRNETTTPELTTSSYRSWATLAVWAYDTYNGRLFRNGVEVAAFMVSPGGVPQYAPVEDVTYDGTGELVVGQGPFDITRVMIFDTVHDAAARTGVEEHLAELYGIVLGR